MLVYKPIGFIKQLFFLAKIDQTVKSLYNTPHYKN